MQPLRHGTRHAYERLKCRCDECVDKQRERNRERDKTRVRDRKDYLKEYHRKRRNGGHDYDL